MKELAEAMGRFRVENTPEQAVVDAMVLFAFADGLASMAELQYIGELRFGGDQPRAFAAIEGATERLRNDGDFEGALARIVAGLHTPAQREEVLAYAVAVAYADLEIKDEEDQAIRWLREALALPFSRTQEICEQVADAVEHHDPVVAVASELPLPPAFTRGDAWPGFRTR
ncbi:MAG: TerB family tellurite resistance protein [Deltaproteobacteria bacterium]|nr:TerB family tellurite resistance protein [Nannocystaceae bacterium]